MGITIGSARRDERGKYSGGSAGDQDKGEVATQSFYMHSKGWIGYRFKKASYASAMATAMKEACDNDNIGYDQGQRGTLLTQFKSTKSIKAIKTKCECDCSSLVRVCIYQATGTLLGDFNTESEPSVLEKSGLFDKKTVNSSADVDNGMILVTKSKGHTVVVVSGRARSSSGSSSSGSSSSGSSSSGSSSSGSSSKLPSYTKNKTYTLQVDKLAVRTGAGTSYSRKSYSKLTSNAKKHAYSSGYLKKGTRVTCKATKTVNGNVWMQIPSGWCAAYYKGKYYIK